MQQEHGAPLSGHERRVLKELEFEVLCQMVIVDKGSPASVSCREDAQWLIECRFCHEATFTCGVHASKVMQLPIGAACIRCGVSRKATKDLFVVRPLPAGAV